MRYPAFARAVALRCAPSLMADRARRYERGFRHRTGQTEEAIRLVAGGPAVVRAGPFAGMSYPPGRLPDVDAAVSKLTGSYELEIQGVFTAALARGVTDFVDVGSADGYYAVGMPFAGPCTTHAFDLSRSARKLCGVLAETNAVRARVHIGARFSPASVPAVPSGLLLCDIEGAEVQLFDAHLIARLKTWEIVIEVHEDAVPGASARLRAAFAATHQVSRVDQRANAHENRPARLHWLLLRPQSV